MVIPFTHLHTRDSKGAWLMRAPHNQEPTVLGRQEFGDWFGSEAACRAYLRRLRWPDGFACPACGVADEPAEMSRGLLRCRACGRQVSLTAGTIFQDTRKPLRTWFLAMWFITSQKNGVSALDLQRVLGLGSYETAPPGPAGPVPFRDRIEGLLAFDGPGCTSCGGR